MTTRGLVLATLWAVAVVGLVRAVDRLLFPPEPPARWQQVEAVQDVPLAAGRPLLPRRPPTGLAWPPSTIVHRTGGATGWWIGLTRETGGELVLWIGAGADPAPALGPAAECLSGTCPAGWSSHEITRAEGARVTLLSALPDTATAAIAAALRHAGPR